MLLYATGLRRTEAANLKVSDIDSSLMSIHVHLGKGARDRELPLTQKLLDALRAYWRASKIKPRIYLFPSHWEATAEEKPTPTKRCGMHVTKQRCVRGLGLRRARDKTSL
jgi:integrase